jgi:hypothetical protein
VSIPHGTYDLRVMANAGAIIETLESQGLEAGTGATPEEIADALWLTASGKLFTATNSLIPMSGKLLKSVQVKEGGAAQSVQLQRPVARVDVGVGEWTATGWDGDGIPFELQQVMVYRANDRYALIPDNDTPTVPTLPAGTVKQATPMTYAAEDKYHIDNTIFVAEAVLKGTPHAGRMALVVAGKYNGGATTYYRVDFADDKGLMDVLRNHLYRFSITGVMGPGYDTPEIALASTSMNMTVNVMDWDDSASTHIAFDGDNYFAIDKREVVFDALGNKTETLSIRTNVPDFKMVEGAVGVTPGGPAYTSATGRNTYTITRSGQSENYTMKIENKAHNITTTGAGRTDNWTFEALRMRIPFKVTQQGRITYITVDGEELTSAGGAKHLFPKGGTAVVSVRSAVPVPITGAESWLTGVRAPALSSGLYQADFTATAGVFTHSMTATNDRISTLTFTPQGAAALRFEISQEPHSLRPSEQSLTGVSIPQAGGTYRFTAFTNYQDWGVKVVTGAASNGTLLVTKAFGTAVKIDPDAPAGFYSVDVAVPKSTTERTLSFWLYRGSDASDKWIKIGEWLQTGISGEATVPTAPVLREEDAPYILYFDGERLAAGQFGNPVAQSNMIFTKFGSLVGFTLTGMSDTWGMDDVKFDPTVTPATTYSGIPYLAPTVTQTDFVTRNHTAANVNAGKGDICRLVGLTPAHARALAAAGKLHEYNSGLYMPSIDDYSWYNQDRFVTASLPAGDGRWLKLRPEAATFLPYAGDRHTGGDPANVGSTGTYWTASSSGANQVYFAFSSSFVRTDSYGSALSRPVRCMAVNPITTIWVTAGAGGKVNVSSHTGRMGETFEVVATPDEGYEFAMWTHKSYRYPSGVGSNLSPATMQHGLDDEWWNAVFDPVDRYMIGLYWPENMGWMPQVTAAQWFGKAGTEIEIRTTLTEGTLVPDPAAGWKFAGWELTNASFAPGYHKGMNPTRIVIGNGNGETIATAMFEPMSQSIILRQTKGGTVIGPASAKNNEVFRLQAIPEQGYRFVRWKLQIHGYDYYSDEQTLDWTMNIDPVYAEAEFVTDTPPYILYWDKYTNTIQASSWSLTGNGGKVNIDNILFFKFGSVVGMLRPGTDGWNASKIKFNPSGATWSYASIPYLDNYSAVTDISSPSYHSLDNVRIGRGDPCKLVGLTVDDINSNITTLHDSGLRMADNNVMGLYASTNRYEEIAGYYGLMIGIDDQNNNVTGIESFLPALGGYTETGAATSDGPYYWSKTMTAGRGAWMLYLTNGVRGWMLEYNTARGCAVRCVPNY